MTDTDDSGLAAQYEAYPYPARDPRDEARRLFIGSPSHLREIDHWVFAARRSRARPLRALVAGGGTGDAVVMLATQLSRDGRAGSVTYLDRSAAAMRIARARVAARGLDVAWRHGSLFDLEGEAFDYIDCCGVLHHLPDPSAGLAALSRVLAPGGGMGLMVYAPHGRTGVYMVQDALRLLAPPEQPLTARLDIARRAVRHLPATAWLRHNRSVTDHIEGGDAGLVDLLLNPRDRAFTIDRFLALLESHGLRATCLMEPLRYDPDAYLPDPRLRRQAAGLAAAARAAVAESLSGTMSTHVVYCVRADEAPTPPDWSAPDAVPVPREGSGEHLASLIRPDGTFPFSCEALETVLPLPALAPAMLRLVDGRRSVGELADALVSRGIARETFERGWPNARAGCRRSTGCCWRRPNDLVRAARGWRRSRWRRPARPARSRRAPSPRCGRSTRRRGGCCG